MSKKSCQYRILKIQIKRFMPEEKDLKEVDIKLERKSIIKKLFNCMSKKSCQFWYGDYRVQILEDLYKSYIG